MPFEIRLNYQGALYNALMLASLIAVLSGVVARFAPSWRPHYLVAACFLVALEASVVHHVFRRDRMWTDELARYLLPELFVMVVLMRVAVTLSLGLATLAESARGWLYDPFSVFDGPFVIAILLGLLVGWLAHSAMQDLFELGPRASDGPVEGDRADPHALVVLNNDRAAALRRVGSRFVVGGLILLVALSLEAVNIERIGGASGPISPLSIAAALTYLISGFLLYSQAQLALLRARWRIEGVAVPAGVTRRWNRMSWLIVAGVALLATALPRAYGMGLLDTIRATVGVLGYVLAFIGYAMIWLVSLIALLPAWLLSLLMGEPGTPSPPVTPPVFEPPPPPEPTVFQQRLLPALIFWICMALLAGYAVWVVLRRNPALQRALVDWAPIAAMLRWVRSLWGDARSWTVATAQRVADRLRRPADMPPSRRTAARLRGLAPRELVRYVYRSTLRRAAHSGLGRRAGQTPDEYRASLAQRLPDSEQDIASLTDAFVAAQYSPRAPAADQARRTVRPWARLRRRLRRFE